VRGCGLSRDDNSEIKRARQTQEGATSTRARKCLAVVVSLSSSTRVGVVVPEANRGKLKWGFLCSALWLCAPRRGRYEAGGWTFAQGEPGKQPVALAKSEIIKSLVVFFLLADFQGYT
jgi:hypothetical protein